MALKLFKRWRASRDASHQLDWLLARADPDAPLAVRNEWLMELGYWLRRRASGVAAEPAMARQSGESLTTPTVLDASGGYSEHARLRFLLQVLDRNGAQAARVGATLRSILKDNDARSLFADTGMAARPGLMGELVARLHARVLPIAPNQAELAVVFALLFISTRDAEWVAALDANLIARLVRHLQPSVNDAVAAGAATGALPELANALSESIVLLCHQIAATALEAPIRVRMDSPQDNARVLMQLTALSRDLMATNVGDVARPQLLTSLRGALAQARTAINSVYEHLERYGVSVDVVFRVERTRLRIDRVDQLLMVWADPHTLTNYSVLTAELITANLARSSVGSLVAESYALLGRKVVERSAETGEHYIARTRTDYFGMLKMAAGGGFVTAFTVYLKFFINALPLNKFAEGVLLSLDYVASFLTIHFAGFTLATKQPAMTAPALAQKLENVSTPELRADFVEETLALIRSQVAAITGNLALVIPVALLVQFTAITFFQWPLISAEKATKTIESFSLLGPTPVFAAFTGVLLWLSSLTAGWADNWFALHRLHDALAYQRRLKWMFGEARAQRFADFVKHHVAGVVATVSLGVMLGMVPTLLAFVGLPIEARHVTLSTGAIAASMGVLGAAPLATAAFWWAVGGVASMAVLNLAVSFALAFSMALRSQGLRTGVRRALRRQVIATVMRDPRRIIFPPKRVVSSDVT
jgi:site-specific recombinase